MKWKMLKSESRYEGFLKVDLCHLRHQTYAGGEIEVQRELMYRGDAVAVLLYDPPRDRLVLIEQFRVGAIDDENGPWLLEIVAGMVEQGESVTEVAQRECMEEAGIEVHSFETVHSFYVSPGACSEKIHVLCALVDSDQASGIHGLAHEHEDIKVVVVDYKDCHDLLASGKISSATPLIALQWLQLNRKRLRTESFIL
ncbi:MAG TPA: NUDIX domain-containing protein [Gammaproteobacteria bacterium]|nr:NUDIX domain-containing protein [Gammaproteobacteria bacterium]